MRLIIITQLTLSRNLSVMSSLLIGVAGEGGGHGARATSPIA